MTTKKPYDECICGNCKVGMGFVLAWNTGKGGGDVMLWQCLKCKMIATTWKE